MKSASASCSMRAVPRSASSFSARIGVDERRRRDEPADPERGRERLARRAGVDDPIGVEALQRADRRAVVAVLGVVVVLDRDRAALAQPAEQRGAALAAQHDAGRVLVGGCQHHGVGVAELVHAQALVVDADRDGLEPGARDDLSLLGVGRVLDRDAPGAAGGERVRHEREPLRVAARHDHASRARRPRRARGRGSPPARLRSSSTPSGSP